MVTKYSQIRHVIVRNQERSETQLHISITLETCKQKRWVSLGLCLIQRV